ncbi:MAG TPA: regulatory protein RecX [Geobacteraceae bacterium]|nr:regulatory protein RecX [Geobacteraceae bacterium]
MDEAHRAYILALKALGRRDHSEAELRRKLADRAVPAGIIDDIVVRLKESGYLDDRRFALRWAESAVRNGRGYGFRLRFELSRRGIADDLASEVSERISAEYDEAEAIRELVERKFAGFTAGEADEKLRRRIVGYLQRRGFSLSSIFRVLAGTDCK